MEEAICAQVRLDIFARGVHPATSVAELAGHGGKRTFIAYVALKMLAFYNCATFAWTRDRVLRTSGPMRVDYVIKSGRVGCAVLATERTKLAGRFVQRHVSTFGDNVTARVATSKFHTGASLAQVCV